MNLNRLAGLMILVILLSACSGPDNGILPSISNGHSTLESQFDPMMEKLEQRCRDITAMYYHLYVNAEKMESQSQWEDTVLSQESIDIIENHLLDAGLDVVDTNGPYPSYLVTGDRFYSFWNDVNQGKNAEQEIIEIRENGSLSYRFFIHKEGTTYVYSMGYPMDGGSVIHYEKYKVLDWELTERGNFYYRIYPAGDKHYSDYALIRMVEPDLELCDLTMKYIWAGGYVGTNIFLIDWTEDDFGDLSFNDLFESLYYDCNGKQFSPEGYEYIIEQDCCMIPAAEFEAVVRPYFDIDMEVFREMARYDVNEDTYPWRQIQTNDFVFLYYYMVEPEVTEYKVNSDGTITLTVEMLSTDLATDCLFAHELTVRPQDNGKFQFVGNRITYQTEYGLPFCEPRLTWNAR